MPFERNIAKPGDPPRVEPYATTPRGYPYPLRSWAPDAAIDIQNLATAIDTDLTAIPAAYLDWTGRNVAITAGNSKLSIAAQASGATGGMTVNQSTGTITVATAGLYSVSFTAYFGTSLDKTAEAVLGSASAPFTAGCAFGSLAYTTPQGAGCSVGSISAFQLAAGSLNLWLWAPAVGLNFTDGALSIRFVGV